MNILIYLIVLFSVSKKITRKFSIKFIASLLFSTKGPTGLSYIDPTTDVHSNSELQNFNYCLPVAP